MKEAAGEANMTVVTIILIGIIVAVVTPIVTTMKNNTRKRRDCQNDGGYWENGQCKNSNTIS